MRVALGVFAVTGTVALTTLALAAGVSGDSYASPTAHRAQPWTLNAAPIHTVVCGVTVVKGHAKPAACNR